MLVLFDDIDKLCKELRFNLKTSTIITTEEKILQLSILRQMEKDRYSNKAKYKASSRNIRKE